MWTWSFPTRMLNRSGGIRPPGAPTPPFLLRYVSLTLVAAALACAPPQLGPEAPVERRLGGGEVHAYQLSLSAEHFVHLVVKQQGIDVAVALFDPAGELLRELDVAVKNEAEELYLVTAEAGGYRLEVRPVAPQGRGRYRAKIEELRPAAPRDRHWVEAEAEYIRGILAAREKTSEAWERAIDHYQRSVELWRLVDDPKCELETLRRLGNAHRLQGRSARALEIYQEALALARNAGDRSGEARILNVLGLAHRRRGELDQALLYYLPALRFWQSEKNQLGEANAHNNLGLVYKDLGEYQRALDHLHRAKNLYENLENTAKRATAVNNLGTIYHALGQFDNALFYYGQALDLNRETGSRLNEARTRSNIARVYHLSGEPRQAIKTYGEALALLRETKDKATEAVTVNNQATLLADLGETQQALENLHHALALREENGDRRGVAKTWADFAILSAQRGQTEEAFRYAARALKRSQEVGDRRVEASARLALAETERRRGNPEAARKELSTAIGLLESLRSGSASYQDRAAFLARKRSYYEHLIDVLMVLDRQHPDQGYDERALEAGEYARARSLLDMLDAAQIDPGRAVDSQLQRRELALKRRINSLELRRMRLATAEGAAAAEIARADEEIQTAVDEYQVLEARIRRQNPRYGALTEPTIPSLRAIQQEILDDETVLLEYSLGQERSFLWLVTPTSMRSFELPKRDELDEDARRVYKLLTARALVGAEKGHARRMARIQRADAALREAMSRLGRTLLGPVADHLGEKRLLIVTEGALAYVPFAALPLPAPPEAAAEALPLVLEHEIVRLPSVSVLAALRREAAARPPAAKTLVILADPVFSADDQRLTRGPGGAEPPAAKALGKAVADSAGHLRPRSEALAGPYRRLHSSGREAESIAALVPAGEVKLACGFEASVELATSGELGRYRYVHFATHGVLHSDHPELSALVLSLVNRDAQPEENGFLRLYEIYNLELNAELVVLSACQTALGREIRGEGLIGLTRGFMYAGAERVLASLWTVQDRPTKELMTRFYRHLVEDGQPPAAALAAAQRSMWREGRFAAPYFWAGFVLQGEWR